MFCFSKRGFKEFGCLENATINEERSSPVNHVSPASDVSPNNKLKNADASLPNEIQSYLLSPAVNSHIDMNAAHAYPSMHSNYYNSEAMNEIPPHPSKAKIQENSPLIRSGGFFEDISGRLIGEPYIDDEAYDEVCILSTFLCRTKVWRDRSAFKDFVYLVRLEKILDKLLLEEIQQTSSFLTDIFCPRKEL